MGGNRQRQRVCLARELMESSRAKNITKAAGPPVATARTVPRYSGGS